MDNQTGSDTGLEIAMEDENGWLVVNGKESNTDVDIVKSIKKDRNKRDKNIFYRFKIKFAGSP